MESVKTKVKDTSKWIDNFIKVITLLSLLLFLVTLYISKYRSGDIYKSQVTVCDTVWSQGMTEENPLNNPIHSMFLENKNNCFDNARRTAQLWEKISFISFGISLLLPSIYFGGKKVIKDTSEKIIRVNNMTNSS